MDKRTVRTKKIMLETYLELLKEMPGEKITPTVLCRRADINRNTFYAYYRRPGEIYDEFATATVKQMGAIINGRLEPREKILSLLRSLREDPSLADALLAAPSSSSITAKLVSITEQMSLSSISQQSPLLTQEQCRMISSFIIAGATAAVSQWVNDSMRDEPEEIADLLLKMIESGVAGLAETGNGEDKLPEG